MMEEIPPPEPLNKREQEILERLAEGLSDREIAAALFLSHNTVRWYNRQIYSKLGVKGRAQAIARARALAAPHPEPATAQIEAESRPLNPERKKAEQQIRFATSFDGTRIAYARSGTGPPLVKTATFMSHLGYDWESPVWRHWLHELDRAHTLIRYDERGNGLSDRDITDFSFEAWVRDLEAVADAAGAQRFPLFAMSQGGCVAVAYAVRHPERVRCLILYGAYARGWLHRDLTPEQLREEQLLLELMRVGWGRDNPAFRRVFATTLQPNATADDLEAMDEQMRVSTSAANAARLEREMHRSDIRAIAPLVTVPTLVVHARGDMAVPFQEGRQLAALIPGAQFVELNSDNHLLTEREPAWGVFAAAVRRFLAAHKD